MGMTEEMKPCPFCGNPDIDPEEVMAETKDGRRITYPGCGMCSGASVQWNSRVGADRSLNEWAKLFHDRSKDAGWWDACKEWTVTESDDGSVSLEKGVAEDKILLACKIALIHSEASEMMEGMRKGVADDHLPHRKMEEVECVDLLIRIFDYAGARGLDLDGAIMEKAAYNLVRTDHKRGARAGKGGKAF